MDTQQDDLNPDDLDQAEDGHSEEDEDADQEGETSDESGAKRTEASEDGFVQISSVELQKLKEERDNYKRGLLSAKAKPRSLSLEAESDAVSEIKQEKPAKVSDVGEEKIRKVLYQENERRVLRDVIDSASSNYMKELVDDATFRDVIQYLPQKLDRSSDDSIRRALKVALHAWKFDRGYTEKSKAEKPAAQMMTSSRRSVAGSQNESAPKTGAKRRILKKAVPITEWYKS